MKIRKLLIGMAWGTAWVVGLSAAWGQGFLWSSPSASATGLGGTYVPSATGALDALSTNPAGLRELGGRVLSAGGSALLARGRFTNSVNTDSPMRTGVAAVPFGAVGVPLGGSRFTVGLAELPEITGDANWTYVDAPGTAGVSYGLQQNRSKIVALRSVGGVGVTVSRRVAVGATVGLEYNTNELHAPYIFQSQPVVKGLKTLLDLHTSGFGWNGSAGVLVRARPGLQMGAAYRSRTQIESTGTATGNLGLQLVALGLAGARPDFFYRAKVSNTLPQRLTVHGTWQARAGWTLAAEGEWVDWGRAFKTLTTELTSGSNADVNGLLGSTSLTDSVPLDWKSQFPVMLGLEHTLTETVVARLGFAHANSAVPNSTLSPLTAVLYANQATAGAGWRRGRFVVDGAYAYTPDGGSSVGKSRLLAGEYDGSRIRVGLQTFTASTTVVF